MIGDVAEFDASAAISARLQGVLVHTGTWKAGDAEGLEPGVSWEARDLGDVVIRQLT